MHWIHQYQLFLFDFDGLLVNTEMLHFEAYRHMIQKRGFSLNWDLKTYCSYAMFDASALKLEIYKELPELYRLEPNWDVLYGEKKREYIALLERGKVELMPHVGAFLTLLTRENKKMCVVTHSPAEQIERIVAQLPLFKNISHWITREHYSQPKPHPECYKKAIVEHAKDGEKVIGFEDSPRGLTALLGSRAEAVLVSELFDQGLKMEREFKHVRTFGELLTYCRA